MYPLPTDLRRALVAGAIATGILTVFMYAAPLLGFPNIDMPAAIGGFLQTPALRFTARWWIGLAVFLAVGIVISPLLYRQFASALYGSSWLKGAEWGVLLWAFGGVCFMFFLGLAFHEPFTNHPQTAVLSSLAGNIVYGAVLGAAIAHFAAGVRGSSTFST